MRKLIAVPIVLFFLIFASSCNEKVKNEEFLFQEGVDDWSSDGPSDWNFVNGELVGVADSSSGFVMTKKSYSNFILELEFKPDSTINSGIYIRCKEREISFQDCYEVNIWDLHPNQDNRTGAIVNKSKPLEIVETLGRWNTYKIKNDKDHLQVWINGIKTVDMKDKGLTEGPIALQAAESGKISFRNVRLTPLE